MATAGGGGRRPAQNGLGALYGNGFGVPQDYAQALDWYRKASAQGLAVAQYNVGFMYYYGQGVPQSRIVAYVRLEIAASNGFDDAAQAREHIGAEMFPWEPLVARRKARQCEERGYRDCF